MDILIYYLQIPELADITVDYLIPLKQDRGDLTEIIKSGAWFLWESHTSISSLIFEVAAETGSVYVMERLWKEGFAKHYYYETIADLAIDSKSLPLLEWIYTHTDKRLNLPDLALAKCIHNKLDDMVDYVARHSTTNPGNVLNILLRWYQPQDILFNVHELICRVFPQCNRSNSLFDNLRRIETRVFEKTGDLVLTLILFAVQTKDCEAFEFLFPYAKAAFPAHRTVIANLRTKF